MTDRSDWNWKKLGPSPLLPHCMTYLETHRNLRILVGIEQGFWHLSISHPDRYPTWDEIKEARYEFLPHSLHIAMILPPPSEYVNLHDNCFHLHELGPREITPAIERAA